MDKYMPEGAFRQLMVDEVGQRTGVTQQRLDQMAESAQSTRLRKSWGKVQVVQAGNREGAATNDQPPGEGVVDTDLALLVHPELAEDLPPSVIEALEDDGADQELKLVCKTWGRGS